MSEQKRKVNTLRNLGRETLGRYLKLKKNIQILEKNVFTIICKNHKSSFEKNYKRLIHEIICDIINKKKLPIILKKIKEGKFFWKSKGFKENEKRKKEQFEFIHNPIDVVEGAQECRKCGSKRILVAQKQVRRADEPETVFSTCIACNTTWVYDG